jgi:hypothetical protein
MEARTLNNVLTNKPLRTAHDSVTIYHGKGMTGLDREGCLRLQAEPPSLVKGATA